MRYSKVPFTYIADACDIYIVKYCYIEIISVAHRRVGQSMNGDGPGGGN